jgi:hypothetical protein
MDNYKDSNGNLSMLFFIFHLNILKAPVNLK